MHCINQAGCVLPPSSRVGVDIMKGNLKHNRWLGKAIMVRGLISAITLVLASSAFAAELDGVAMPDTRAVHGIQMRLNGIGLRSFSILGIPIYVAGLYLERYSNDQNAVLHSQEMKLLDIRFLRDVDAEDARKAWQDGFNQNCVAPCYLNPGDIQRFLAAVPSMHKGDETTLLFTAKGLEAKFNGQSMGEIADRNFAEAMLATFIGPKPPTPQLKRALLGNRE
jgi:chalcone isomerase-like protein